VDSENTIKLVKELEKINAATSKNSYFGAWVGLFLGIVYLTYIFVELNKDAANYNWVYAFFFVMAIIILLQSLYIIISSIIYKKISLVIKSVLDLGKADKSSSVGK
jgi:hypothetical protein